MTSQATPKQVSYASRMASRLGWTADEIASLATMTKAGISETIDTLEGGIYALRNETRNVAYIRRFNAKYGTSLGVGA